MKFGKVLVEVRIPEWTTQYVRYKALKKLIKRANTLNTPLAPDAISEYAMLEKGWPWKAPMPHTVEDYDFLIAVYVELVKVNDFYTETIAGMKERGTALDENLNAYMNPDIQAEFNAGRSGKSAEKMLRKGYIEYYRGLDYLSQFTELNFTAFEKILKKFDKNRGEFQPVKYLDALRSEIQSTTFYEGKKEMEDLIAKCEHRVTSMFSNGVRKNALKLLRRPEQTLNIWAVWRMGLFLGCCLPLFIVFVLGIPAVEKKLSPEDGAAVFLVYRGLAMPVLMIWFFGINVFVWGKFRINFAFIYGLVPPWAHFQQYHEMASWFSIVWFLSATGMVLSAAAPSPPLGIPLIWHPLAAVLVYLIIGFFPFKCMMYKSRRWMLTVLGRIFMAPRFTVKFKDFFIADQLTSLVVLLFDSEFILCFYLYELPSGNGGSCLKFNKSIRPILAMLPTWWRFAQCIRRYVTTKDMTHLYNAGKYFSAVPIVITAAILGRSKDTPYYTASFVCWVIASLVGCLYKLFWDIRKDWGVFSDLSSSSPLKRSNLVYPPVAYYFAIVFDIIARFAWVYGLSAELGASIDTQERYIFTVTSIIEITRRFVWNFFRMENEHSNNCGKFRAVNLRPLPFDLSSVRNMRWEQASVGGGEGEDLQFLRTVDGTPGDASDDDSYASARNGDAPSMQLQEWGGNGVGTGTSGRTFESADSRHVSLEMDEPTRYFSDGQLTFDENGGDDGNGDDDTMSSSYS